MALVVSGDLIEAHELSVAPDLDFARPQRPRAHKTHIAGQNIPELRQLVHRGRAQQLPHTRDAAVVLGSLHGPSRRFCVGNHGPEFQRLEDASTPPDARLAKEHGSPVLEPDGDGDDRPQGRRDEQPE